MLRQLLVENLFAWGSLQRENFWESSNVVGKKIRNKFYKIVAMKKNPKKDLTT